MIDHLEHLGLFRAFDSLTIFVVVDNAEFGRLRFDHVRLGKNAKQFTLFVDDRKKVLC